MEIKSKLIIFCAPSGSGKTTIAKAVVGSIPKLAFSISATTRDIRGNEKEGVDYYYLTAEEFKKKRANNEFAESEEVYENKFYGTLKSEIERINTEGKIPVADVDVVGAQQLKENYKENALLIFIKAPSLSVIEDRLNNRKTETAEAIKIRLARVPRELTYEDKCDVVVMNIELDQAIQDCIEIIMKFLELNN